MRYLITGATGLLGRNVLYEILRREWNKTSDLEIILLGRGKHKETSFATRVQRLFNEDGAYVLKDIGINKLDSLSELGIQCLEADLNAVNLGLSEKDKTIIRSKRIDYVHHIAAKLDFRSSEKTITELKLTNFLGTKKLLDLLIDCEVGEFCYVGSAYSCGMTTGTIDPNYINLEQEFRNPYEKIKLETEVYVREYCRSRNMKYRIFRPATIAGNLINPPIGFTPKFDVFYGWSLFFLRTKYEMLKTLENLCETPVSIECRVHCNNASGLNIVPADYAAKVIYEICRQKSNDESFHLVNDDETPHKEYIPLLIKAVSVDNIQIVEKKPNNLNFIENIYYHKSVGSIFTPYITMKPMLFSTENLKPILNNAQLSCPPVDKTNFKLLMDYAKECQFGLKELLNIDQS